MSEDEVNSLIVKYKAARKSRIGAFREVNEFDRNIFRDYQGGKTLKELSTLYGISQMKVLYSIALASK